MNHVYTVTYHEGGVDYRQNIFSSQKKAVDSVILENKLGDSESLGLAALVRFGIRDYGYFKVPVESCDGYENYVMIEKRTVL
jgi:hypothetical protein